MKVNKRLSLAISTASDISHKTEDLRGIMEKMSLKQRELFKDLIKGEHIIKIFIKRKMLKELAALVPTVKRLDERIVNVEKLKWGDYKFLYTNDQTLLAAKASQFIGRDYKKFIVDVKWMFKMLSLDAIKTVATIMEDKHVAAQTRLSAAQDILNRADYLPRVEPPKEHFPVSVVIRYDKTPKSDGIVEGEIADASPDNH